MVTSVVWICAVPTCIYHHQLTCNYHRPAVDFAMPDLLLKGNACPKVVVERHLYVGPHKEEFYLCRTCHEAAKFVLGRK